MQERAAVKYGNLCLQHLSDCQHLRTLECLDCSTVKAPKRTNVSIVQLSKRSNVAIVQLKEPQVASSTLNLEPSGGSAAAARHLWRAPARLAQPGRLRPRAIPRTCTTGKTSPSRYSQDLHNREDINRTHAFLS